MSKLALIFQQMQISNNCDGTIFLVSIILCTGRAFEIKIINYFMTYAKKLIIILRIHIKDMKIFLTELIFPKNRGFQRAKQGLNMTIQGIEGQCTFSEASIGFYRNIGLALMADPYEADKQPLIRDSSKDTYLSCCRRLCILSIWAMQQTYTNFQSVGLNHPMGSEHHV